VYESYLTTGTILQKNLLTTQELKLEAYTLYSILKKSNNFFIMGDSV